MTDVKPPRTGVPRKGPVRDRDLGDLWRLTAVADPGETAAVIAEFVDHSEVGDDVRQSVEWTTHCAAASRRQ